MTPWNQQKFETHENYQPYGILLFLLCYSTLLYYTQNYPQVATRILLTYKSAWIFHHVHDNFRKTALLECILNGIKIILLYALFGNDCSVRGYWSFVTLFHKCMNITINVFHIIHYAGVICLMLSVTHCA